MISDKIVTCEELFHKIRNESATSTLFYCGCDIELEKDGKILWCPNCNQNFVEGENRNIEQIFEGISEHKDLEYILKSWVNLTDPMEEKYKILRWIEVHMDEVRTWVSQNLLI